ncbi:hypothetical protein LDL79_10445 [Leeuwenhoekiella palythoae]|uniref:hypothetical protein n=1 Tax=Leeuwenhoekiella palythoae TaxID=573501 RepID=UPI001CE22F7D|nr:hypothetical protein [Leeuwenhoekiella palythoae]UBZ09232.1 hypothetical protein LDL79_10445 [Leeuwenhoekiella palythoae]
MPVYVDDNGTMVLRPSLVQTYMPVNINDFINEIEIRSNNGAGNTLELYSTTITLSQQSLVEVIYQMGVGITTYNRQPVTDGAARMYRGWFTVNNGVRLGLDTGTYTNNPDNSDPNGDGIPTYASGLYFLGGSGFVQLPPGTHTIRVYGLGFGGEFGYTMTYGGGNGDNFQIIVHR